jgi:hypothetical protein
VTEEPRRKDGKPLHNHHSYQAPTPKISPQSAQNIFGIAEASGSLQDLQVPKLYCIAGDFEPHFWNHTMLQFSHSYPTVQQAILALSVIYEGNQRDIQIPMKSSTVTIQDPRALQQYNLAVSHLIEYISSSHQDSRATLLSCLVFVWIEFLQNNLESAFKHLDSGLKILDDLSKTLPVSSLPETLAFDNAKDIYGSIRRSFTRLRSQAALHGTCNKLPEVSMISSTTIEVVAPIPPKFSSVFESRSFLDAEISFIFGYLRQLRDKDHYASVDILVLEGIREERLKRIRQWNLATIALRVAHSGLNDTAQISSFAYLELYFIFLSIILKTTLSGTEMMFDEYTSEFEQMIILAESIINSHNADNISALSFDMNIILPLMFLVLKCRVLRLRRQAVALLRRGPEREGIWRRESVIKVCEWKMMMEEQGRGQLAETDILPASARIYREHIRQEDGRNPSENTRPQICFSRGNYGTVEYVPMPDNFEDVYEMGNML